MIYKKTVRKGVNGRGATGGNRKEDFIDSEKNIIIVWVSGKMIKRETG